MTAGYPLGLCAIGSSALLDHCPGLKWLAGCPLLTIGLEGRSMKPPPNPLSGDLGNAGLTRTEWKVHRLSLGLLGVSWVVPCLLKELLKLGINNEVLAAWGFKVDGDLSSNNNGCSSKPWRRKNHNIQQKLALGNGRRWPGSCLLSSYGSNSQSPRRIEPLVV